MSGLHFVDDIPFETVYIHALIRDAEGKKMSKSRGNVIDPIIDIEKYGADALRFTLASLAVPGRDVFLSEERIEGSRNYINKIWNAARFVLSNVEKEEEIRIVDSELRLIDRWILSELNELISMVEKYIEEYDFSKASKALHEFFWLKFADWYIELAKPRIYSNQGSSTVKAILVKVLDDFCRLAHPIMPFVTEEIWQMLPQRKKSIVLEDYPKKDEKIKDDKSVEDMNYLIEVITEVRTIRSELRVKPSSKIDILIKLADEKKELLLNENVDYIEVLAKASKIKIGKNVKKPKTSATGVVQETEVYIPISGLVDINEEIKRSDKEIKSIEKDLESVSSKITNKQFINKAPEKIVKKVKKKEKELITTKSKLEEQLKVLKDLNE